MTIHELFAALADQVAAGKDINAPATVFVVTSDNASTRVYLTKEDATADFEDRLGVSWQEIREAPDLWGYSEEHSDCLYADKAQLTEIEVL